MIWLTFLVPALIGLVCMARTHPRPHNFDQRDNW